jgi:hypothetical protein
LTPIVQKRRLCSASRIGYISLSPVHPRFLPETAARERLVVAWCSPSFIPWGGGGHYHGLGLPLKVCSAQRYGFTGGQGLAQVLALAPESLAVWLDMKQKGNDISILDDVLLPFYSK